jgi:membrane associated rhomboid family serine protease
VLVCIGTFVVTLVLCACSSEEPGATLLRGLWSLPCPLVLEKQGALVLGRVWIDKEWWRVVTTVFVHGSVLHLVLNTWSLWVVGEWAEAAWGTTRALAVFVASSIAGCLASLAWCEAPVVVGASGGVMGLAGGLLVARTVGRPSLQKRLEPVSARALGGFLVALVVIGWFVPVIAQAGHIGGVLAGVLLGAWLSRDRSSRRQGLWATLVVATLGVLVCWARAPKSRAGYHEFRGYRYLELEQFAAATDAFDRALERRPSDVVLANAVAYALAESGTDLERAEVLARRALVEEPDNADYLDTLGWTLCRSGRVADGLKVLRRGESLASRPIPEIAVHLRECESAGLAAKRR